MLCKEAPLTVQCVGQRTLNPGVPGASSSLSFSNIVPRFGENLISFEISNTVAIASLRFGIFFMVSQTASCSECPWQYVNTA